MAKSNRYYTIDRYFTVGDLTRTLSRYSPSTPVFVAIGPEKPLGRISDDDDTVLPVEDSDYSHRVFQGKVYHTDRLSLSKRGRNRGKRILILRSGEIRKQDLKEDEV